MVVGGKEMWGWVVAVVGHEEAGRRHHCVVVGQLLLLSWVRG
jgi:hypothetical protein